MQTAPRPPLNQVEQMILSPITFICTGQWSEVGLNRSEAAGLLWSALQDFHSQFAGQRDVELGLVVFKQLQNSLMLQRQGSFEQIQEHPAFSITGEEILNRLDQASKTGWFKRRSYNAAFDDAFCQGAFSPVRNEIITRSGGDGSSMETAIRFNSSDHIAGVNAEYWFLNYEYGTSFEKHMQSLIRDPKSGASFDCLEVEIDGVGEREFWFDVSAWM